MDILIFIITVSKCINTYVSIISRLTVVSRVAKKNSLRHVYQECIIRVGIAYKKRMTKLTFPQLESFPYRSYKLLIVPAVHNPKSSRFPLAGPKI